MSELVKVRRLVAEIVADREEGTEDAWWHSNISDFVLDESYGEHDGQNGADRRRMLRVPAVERALIAALDLTAVDALQAEVERLRALLDRWVNIATHCDITDGMCCCGGDMSKHPQDAGHSPTDHGAYVADQALRDTLAALKETDNG